MATNTAFQLGFDGTYTSFSGADAIASFNGQIIGELQALTINVSREKGPIYVLGDADPISFSRGKRGIAGNLVFVMFDHNALMTAMESWALANGSIPQYISAGDNGGTSLVSPPTTLRTNANTYTGLPLNGQNLNANGISTLSTIYQLNTADQLASNVTNPNNGGGGFVELHGERQGEYWTYDDQIPPFDITITFANEYGNAANLIIHQVEILNFGMGISIDDINLENAMTFVARKVERLRPGFNTSGQLDTSTPASNISVTPVPQGATLTQ